MTEDQAFDDADIDATEDDEGDGSPASGQSAGPSDPFERASQAAEKELSGEKPKPAKKAAKEESPAKAKPEAKQAEPEDEDDASEPQAVTKPKKEAKKFWSREKREAFAYQPEHVQRAWLDEEPMPSTHWPEEQREAFHRLPREAKEALLEQSVSLERGYGQKFEALAGERKFAESIRQAVPPQLRSIMQQRGVDEVGAFKGLLELQRQAMEDPVSFVREFIAKNNIDPRHFVAFSGEQSEGMHSPIAPQQADIESHPAYRALKAEFASLKDSFTGDYRAREEESQRRTSEEMHNELSRRDESGAAAYPYIRLLSNDMAQILSKMQENDPGRYRSMGIPAKMADAYKIALEAYPELKTMQQRAKPVQVDEPEDEEANSEVDFEAERLKKAATKKSKTPQTTGISGRNTDPFERASAKAMKQLGY